MLILLFKNLFMRWGVVLFLPLLVTSCDETIYYSQLPEEQPPAVYVVESGFSFEISASVQNELSLEAIAGEIEVIGDSAANVVVLEGRKVVTANSPEAAQAALAHISVKIARLLNRLIVTSEHPSQTNDLSYEVDYTIKLPQNWQVNVILTEGNILIRNIDAPISTENFSGDVTLHNIKGNIALRNTNGDVTLSDINGNVAAELTNGNIDAAIAIPENGSALLTTQSGNITLQIPSQTGAILNADATTGVVQIFNLVLQQAVFGQHSIRGVLNNGDGHITLTTANGNIVINGF
jgi:hypothetical protein